MRRIRKPRRMKPERPGAQPKMRGAAAISRSRVSAESGVIWEKTPPNSASICCQAVENFTLGGDSEKKTSRFSLGRHIIFPPFRSRSNPVWIQACTYWEKLKTLYHKLKNINRNLTVLTNFPGEFLMNGITC